MVGEPWQDTVIGIPRDEAWLGLISKQSGCKLGGLHPLTVNMIVKVHVLLFSKHRPRSVYSVKNLHESPHFSHMSVGEIIGHVDMLNSSHSTCIEVVIHPPERNLTENIVKFITEGTPDWESISPLYDQLGMEGFSKDMLHCSLKRDECRGNIQRDTAGLARGIAPHRASAN